VEYLIKSLHEGRLADCTALGEDLVVICFDEGGQRVNVHIEFGGSILVYLHCDSCFVMMIEYGILVLI
jgi:hypothetical protein